MEIKNTYLMWIGSEHYASIEDWCTEAKEQGVSKRLPNEHSAKALMEPGTVIFVAHDEGEHEDCPTCAGEAECPACRRHAEKEARELALADHLEAEAEKMRTTWAKPGERVPVDSLEKRAKNARERAEAAATAQAECEDCLGSGLIKSGTGGKVAFEDGETWDYRRYNYFLHQPKKWTPDDKGGVREIAMCADCGGTGRLPKGQVFGLFVPDRMEYIRAAGDEERAAALSEAGFKLVERADLEKEKKRKCGVRKAGGVYAVTKAGGRSKAGERAASKLGLDAAEIEVHGNFVRFLVPVAIPGVKRCRGLARFVLPEAVSEEAEMIAEASE